MAIARDWLNTLWDASYKGVPFLVERDNERGSRRIVKHEFPMRDTPFLEDLGEGVRDFSVTGYVASDGADGEAAAVMSICATRGPGIIVLPAHGPILVRCTDFERDRSKDKHGYIAVSMTFSREGASGALISSAVLSNMTFVAVDNLALQIATTFVANAITMLQPDFVMDALSEGLRDAVAMVETVRTTNAVEPVASAAQRNELIKIYDAVPELVTEPDQIATAPARIVAAARAVADAMSPGNAMQAFDEVIQSSAPSDLVITQTYPTQRRRDAAYNAEEAARVGRLAAISAYCEAVVRVPLADRPAAITLRANVQEYLGAELEAMSANEIDLYSAVAAVRDATIEYLSKSILDLAPVARISANLEMPSLYWAWRLYKDANRSTEIVARNRLVHPSFVPLEFEALTE